MSKYEIDEETGEVLFNRSVISSEDVVDRLNDLEAKLAESEKERELDNTFWKQECDSLQKTLAQKEKENESLRENSLARRIFDEKLIPSHCMEQYEKYEQQIEQHNQDKIELLERVKNKLKTFEFNYNGSIDCCEDNVFIILDNIIKEIKGERK